jgi:nucleoside-diphosphate-sugar epimerase
MKWTGRPVLVTGASGFAAGHLAGRPTNEGAQICTVVRTMPRRDPGTLRMTPSEVRSQVEAVRRDLRDPAAEKKVKQLSGWRSRTTLETGLRQTANWRAAHIDPHEPTRCQV